MDYDKEHREIQMIERYLDCRDHDILEVGCGKGQTSALLAPKARTYVAIDHDPQRIDQARKASFEVDFRIGNGEALAFADASFDGILFTLSLHHQESRVALQEAHRVLTTTGQVVIVEPTIAGEFQQFFHLFDDESEALAQSLRAIAQSDFALEHHETFCTIVTFQDHEELCSYPFDRTTYQPDDCDRILDKLRQLQGPLTDGQEIRLQEKLHIFSLRKTGVS